MDYVQTYGCGYLYDSSTGMPVRLSENDSLNYICHAILLTIYFSSKDKKFVELADIRAAIDTRLKKSIDEQTWQQALTILIEKGLIETRGPMFQTFCFLLDATKKSLQIGTLVEGKYPFFGNEETK